MNIYSSKIKNKLLGIIYRYKAISKKRKDISPINEYLQISSKKYQKNDSINPHIHLKNKRTTLSTQEAWIILKGRLSVKIFDTDKTKIKSFILNKGDIYILFSGGHSFKVLSNNAEFYEIKNGPYKKKVKDIEYLKY
jgi:cupin fold WbuC family metalloprotein|tara:strand:+ start:202 stop:612 length:411 start_codon:yes stop_codon:yes gene_type:complete